MANARIVCGVNSVSLEDVVGLTVEELRTNDAVEVTLHLNGDEACEVRVSGGTFESVDEDYVVQSGDTVRFTRSAGTKG